MTAPLPQTPTLPVRSEPWLLHAACRGADSNIFFPPRGANRQMLQAKQICFTCPVRPDCLQYALDNHCIHGVFGGTSERERRRLRSSLYNAALPPTEAQP